MNRVRPHCLAALTAVCVLAVILLGTGCGAAMPRGAPVLAASTSPDRTGTGQPDAAADSGIGGCTVLLGTHQAAVTDYPRIRAQVAHSPWPGLRAAGMSYVDPGRQAPNRAGRRIPGRLVLPAAVPRLRPVRVETAARASTAREHRQQPEITTTRQSVRRQP